MTNRNDHGFPELRRQDDLDAEFGNSYRDERFRHGVAVVALVVTAVVVAAGVALTWAFFYVAAGGL